jgi:putative ABC transport system substrate-binding protein
LVDTRLPDRLSEYAADLVKSQVDVIGATGNMAIRVAQEATKIIPILAVTDGLLGSGLVNSMGRPSGNTTGVSILAGDLDGKRQDILIEAVPGLRLMAVLADINFTNAAKLDALQEAARTHGVELSIHRVARGEEIAAALDSAKASGPTALNVLASPVLYTNRNPALQAVLMALEMRDAIGALTERWRRLSNRFGNW